mgnify:CR=1 FL=1
MDFTLKIYQSLLSALRRAGYTFRTFEEFLSVPADGKVVILRHDIDKRPENALRMAQMEHASGIKASYYIRVVKGTWNEEVIERIVALGHEMSYHYEDLTIAKGNHEKAFEYFKKHLAEIRRFYPAKTVCMHGSPLSRWDNRKLWEKYNYREAGIIGEPYFDVDYTDIFFGDDDMVIYNESECQIFTTDGVEKYHGSFGKSARLLLPAGGSYKYYLVTDSTIDTIQLK